MNYAFKKMHGLGNDFIIVDARDQNFELSSIQIAHLSDRRMGIGCDQFIVLKSPTDPVADVLMHIFNADGTQAGACGNAARCLGAYLQKITGKNTHCIETTDRKLHTEVQDSGLVKVDMGRPSLHWQDIPLSHDMNTLFLPIHVPGLSAPAAVSMGNPHLIFFVPDLKSIDLDRYGRELTAHPYFPEQTNVEFIEIITRQIISMRVWERGTGITPACATGAAASVVAGIKRGMLDFEVTVQLDGGDLKIEYTDSPSTQNSVHLTGQVAFSFEGKFSL